MAMPQAQLINAYAMKARQIEPRPGDERGESGHEIQRLQHHVGRAIPERLFVLVHDPALAIHRQALGSDRRDRIAVYSAESNPRTQFLDMNAGRIENPEIIAKLMNPDAQLNEIEWVQAIYTARQQSNTWIDAENAVINGLLSELTYQEIFRDIDVVVKEMPGLIPAFEYLFEAYGVDENSELETMAYLFKAVRNYQQEHPGK